MDGHAAIGTWFYLFVAGNVPMDNGEAGVENSLQVLQTPAANQPRTVFEINNQGIYHTFSTHILHSLTFIILNGLQ